MTILLSPWATIHWSHPIQNVKRWVRGKGQINVSQPAMIRVHNAGMEGVDYVDRALSQYRLTFHGNVAMVFFFVNGAKISQKDYIP